MKVNATWSREMIEDIKSMRSFDEVAELES